MNNTKKRIKKQHENQEKDLKEWLDGYKKRIDRHNEPQRIAHRKEIESFLQSVGQHFNLR